MLIDEYENTLEQLVGQTKPVVKGFIFMSPFYLEPNRSDAMRKVTDEYCAAMKRVATKHGTLFVDTQASFDNLLRHRYPTFVSSDRVHVNSIGNMVIARALLGALEFDWSRQG